MQHRVFLSSTFSDLVSHRQAIQLAIRQLGAVDVSMEHFGARDERPLEECVRLVSHESDIFVGIYAHKYGFVPEGMEHSISELEYKAASDASLPRFIYLIDEAQPWLPAHIDSGEASIRLNAFKSYLLKRHIWQKFGGQDQLATKVVADVGRHIAMKAAPKVGIGIPVQDIGLESLLRPVVESMDEWSKRRIAIYSEHRGTFITHIIRPSSKPGQTFDVFIYLMRHESDDLSDIRVAEFFLGPYWGNKVFPAVEKDGFIGISTSAYGTFLCLCRVTFQDGSFLYLERYIDSEMQRTGGAAT